MYSKDVNKKCKIRKLKTQWKQNWGCFWRFKTNLKLIKTMEPSTIIVENIERSKI